MVYVTREPIVDIDPNTNEPRLYAVGEVFPRVVEALVKKGLLEIKEDITPKKKIKSEVE